LNKKRKSYSKAKKKFKPWSRVMATQKIMEKKQNQYAFASWPKNHRSRPPFRFIFPAHLAMLIDVHLWLTSLIRPLRCQGSGRGIITGHLSSMHFDVYVDPGSTRNKEQPKRYKDTNVRWYGATERIWPKKKRLLQGVTSERTEERMAPARLRNGLFGSGQQS